jgi:hypothetical protein
MGLSFLGSVGDDEAQVHGFAAGRHGSDGVSQCIQYPVPVLHSRPYYSLTITNAQDQSCSNQEQ